MEIGKIITFNEGKDELLLDKIALNGKDYLYTVEVDSEDMPTYVYHYYELNDDEVEVIEDKELIGKITSIIADKNLDK